ncbi:hypothetical protein ACIQ9R_21145 [Streptomyces sp. NPDC094447]|uniref:hypothetical protein n=1 Tax=Streptomyces sp. NPDC094447 TaxID=3366062 RepID=UPI00382384C3
MSEARHRFPRPTPFVRADRSGRFALTFLTFAGLVGPAWALRTHADELLDAAGNRLVVTAPDAVPPSLAIGR